MSTRHKSDEADRQKYRHAKPAVGEMLDDRRRVGQTQHVASHSIKPDANRSTGRDSFNLLDLPADTDDDWPDPLEGAAFCGVAGEFVKEVLPETESDKAALLFHFLTFVGAMFGRARYYPVGGTQHHCRLFSVAVGGTASGRKGTALDCVSHVMRLVDAGLGTDGANDGDFAGVTHGAGFCDQNVVSGLTSGAGLIWSVRDESDRKKSVDPGVDDKRLLVVESEFGGVLRVCKRKENDLSAVIRDCWDGKNLRTLSKQEPAKATAPHISVIGHVTREELRSTLSTIDVTNGFSNRILWYCARRSKLLPDGGSLFNKDFSGLIEEIGAAIRFAQAPARMTRSRAARDRWHEVYGDLSSGRPGVVGSVTTRAEAQVLRLSMLYSLLDRSSEIGVEHLEAALAVWKYSAASARWAFGSSLGNPTADELLSALREARPAGMSSTEISALFNRNRSALRIREALGMLKRLGLARDEKPDRSGPGARPTIWFAS